MLIGEARRCTDRALACDCVNPIGFTQLLYEAKCSRQPACSLCNAYVSCIPLECPKDALTSIPVRGPKRVPCFEQLLSEL